MTFDPPLGGDIRRSIRGKFNKSLIDFFMRFREPAIEMLSLQNYRQSAGSTSLVNQTMISATVSPNDIVTWYVRFSIKKCYFI